MSITKRRLEATESDYNEALRLCVACGDRIEYEADARSWRLEHSIVGPFTTVWVCGCKDIRSGCCVRCGSDDLFDAEVPVCDGCIEEYEETIANEIKELACARCSNPIPKEEIGLFLDSGLCGWCEHMTSKAEVHDEPWNPETNLELAERRVITLEEFRDNGSILIADPRLLDYLDHHPDEMFALSAREFEEFVSELLRGFGYRTRLGPRGRDGGVDVFADRDLDTGPELVLVQCKKFAPDQKVSQPVVKQLSADVQDRRASRGLVVTTSTFTKPAIDYIEQTKYRLAGADFERLQEWVRRLRR